MYVFMYVWWPLLHFHIDNSFLEPAWLFFLPSVFWGSLKRFTSPLQPNSFLSCEHDSTLISTSIPVQLFSFHVTGIFLNLLIKGNLLRMIIQILTLFFLLKENVFLQFVQVCAVQCSLFPLSATANGPLCRIHLLLLVIRWLPLSAACTSLSPLNLLDLSASSGKSSFLTHVDHFYGSLYLNSSQSNALLQAVLPIQYIFHFLVMTSVICQGFSSEDFQISSILFLMYFYSQILTSPCFFLSGSFLPVHQ